MGRTLTEIHEIKSKLVDAFLERRDSDRID
jgi:hypothetical protein